ncbi:hypothetical protein [Acutalibacter sp. 1XD8-33]|nr:hypothetical protein [Acutalibacter sp. 1XD8-33]
MFFPIPACQLLGYGFQLVGQTALVCNAVSAGQSGCDSFGVFLPVFP